MNDDKAANTLPGMHEHDDGLNDDSDADAFAVLSLMLIIALAVVYFISNQ